MLLAAASAVDRTASSLVSQPFWSRASVDFIRYNPVIFSTMSANEYFTFLLTPDFLTYNSSWQLNSLQDPSPQVPFAQGNFPQIFDPLDPRLS
jgi:hypothetical protein